MRTGPDTAQGPSPAPGQPPRKRPQLGECLVVSFVVLVGYAAAAYGVDNAFPFSTFPMYSGNPTTSGARLVVKDRVGAYSEIARWERWSCATAVDEDSAQTAVCPDGGKAHPIGYLVKEATDHMRAHRGDPAAQGAAQGAAASQPV